jgi:hypothetical protein
MFSSPVAPAKWHEPPAGATLPRPSAKRLTRLGALTLASARALCLTVRQRRRLVATSSSQDTESGENS